jgi:hypothetical protein
MFLIVEAVSPAVASRQLKRRGFIDLALVAPIMLLEAGSAWAQAAVLTYHNDNSRGGTNIEETQLTPVNVPGNFGRLFSQLVDGEIYAQPLYVPNLSIPGRGSHNLVVMNTEHDSVYAFDADSNANGNAAPLWQISLIDSAHGAAAGAAPVPASAYPVDSDNLPDCGSISPELGSTSTPVIDTGSGTVYVEAFSYEGGTYVHRLHALDLTTGAEKTFGPVVIGGTVAGTGDGGTTVTFNPYAENNRAALLLASGTVYVAFAGSCGDQVAPFHGWLFAYAAGTLKQTGTFLTTPNGGLGGIWMTGSGPAADASGNVYLSTGNGLFDTVNNPATDFGDSILKLTLGSGGLAVADYFTPYNQQTLADNDVDVSSGGVMLLPDQPGPYPHELVAAGKEGRIYLINRDQFTLLNQHYCANCASDPQIVQESASGEINGVFSSPVYWNGTVYYWTPDLYLKAYPLVNGLVNYGGVSISTDAYRWPGANLSISGNGTSNGIIWALKTDAYATGGAVVLRAYDAANLNNRLYSSDQNANDAAGPAVRFTVPTVVNGKVYVGSHDRLSIYGLLSGTPTPTPSATPTSTSSVLPTPTPNPTPTATPTGIITPTPTPTLAPTPTLTPTTTPTSTPTPAGSIAIVTAPTSTNYGCGKNYGNVMNIGTPNAKVKAGDTLMLVVNLAPGAHVTGITDGYGAIGDVWQEASNVYGNDTNGGATDIWFASNIVGATNGAPFTINTTAGNTFIGACLFEVQGLATANPQDGGAALDTTTPVTTLLSPAISGSSAPELFVTVSACANYGNSTASVGGVQFNAMNGATNGVGGCPAGYYIASAPGTYQAALTQSPPGSGVVAIASFRP